MEEESGNGELPTSMPEEELRLLLDPLRKDQLVDLLVKLKTSNTQNNPQTLCIRGIQNYSVAKEIRGVASTDPVHCKLFVCGLAWETTSETLCAGHLTVCNLLACEGLSNATATSDQAQRKLYIGGLAPNISSENLLNFFSRHGEIEEGSVAYDRRKNSRGFGFVTYKTVEAAKKALEDPNKTLGVRNITIKLAESHKIRGPQTQIPPAVVPLPVPLSARYAQPGKTHIGGPGPVGYAHYPRSLTTYPPGFSTSPSQYSQQSQIPYPHINPKKDLIGLPAPIGGYPYCV
ncbi:hypothetical protein QJS10_CPB22g01470 [Acorus calamus]|uniref:RRM domain-containing protein n=1 Tax=Acorus calamus TaxID=4465 RepID=A0AAV9C1Q8_ACOCL|nr:hypothetical protein QJS10_CPB22g01470 [Acorus calamus]